MHTLTFSALDRAGARRRLLDVSAGSPALPLTPHERFLYVSETMRSLRPNFDEPVTLERAVHTFVGLLKHPDLPDATLERIATDGLLGHPNVLRAFFAHPGSGQFVLDAALTAWTQLRSASLQTGPLGELLRHAPYGAKDELLEVLSGHSTTGRLAALLLKAGLGSDVLAYFRAGHMVRDAGPAAMEVAVTFLGDSPRLDRDSVSLAVERACLVLGA